jgi:hypothetical protein
MFTHQVDLEASEELLCEGVNLLMKDYPKDVAMDLAGEIKYFHIYIKQNYSEK